MTRLLLFIFSVWAVYYGYQEYHIGRYFSESGYDITYGKADLNVEVSGREVDFIVVNERFKDENCNEDIIDKYLAQMCTSALGCTPKNYSCNDSVGSQYSSMFNKKTAATKYLHVVDEQTGLVSIMLFWGLTSEESESSCKLLKQSFDTNKKLEYQTNCI